MVLKFASRFPLFPYRYPISLFKRETLYSRAWIRAVYTAWQGRHMRPRFYNRRRLSSIFYAFLIVAQPALLLGAIGQLIAYLCVCGLLIFIVAYRDELCELATTAPQGNAPLFASLIPLKATWQSDTDLPLPDTPILVPLFQRPPPLFA
jgi:hypothetical protein